MKKIEIEVKEKVKEKVKIIEIFNSLQGEGPIVGSPSLFIRFCGCNMKCMFNCSKGEEEQVEALWKEEIKAAESGTLLKDLRLFSKGCDSYPAITPEIYNKVAKDYSTQELAEVIVKNKMPNIILTGGEPMLRFSFIDRIRKRIEEDAEGKEDTRWWFETNGTIDIEQAIEKNYHMVISPKIKYMSYNQKLSFTENIEKIAGIIKHNKKCKCYFKFVVEDVEDLDRLLEFNSWIEYLGFMSRLYIMPQGGQLDGDFLERSGKIADRCIELGINFTPRLQNYLWKNKWGK